MKVFINYRRDDVRADAARIRDRLAGTFGARDVFMDVDNLLAGQRFDKELEKALAKTDVFLAVIGPHWMDLLRQRQESKERDYVCEEISAALRSGTLVIPILIQGTSLPQADALPSDIRELVLHQKHDVTHERFGRDIEDLLAAIKAVRKGTRPVGRSTGGRLLLGAAVSIALLTAGIAIYLVRNGIQLPTLPLATSQPTVPSSGVSSSAPSPAPSSAPSSTPSGSYASSRPAYSAPPPPPPAASNYIRLVWLEQAYIHRASATAARSRQAQSLRRYERIQSAASLAEARREKRSLQEMGRVHQAVIPAWFVQL